jgi:nucleoid-associated protein EbfC
VPDEPEQPDEIYSAGAGVPGLPDLDLGGDALGGLLAEAQKLMAAQAEAAELEVEGVAGGGVVRILTTGTGQALRVSIAPEVVDAADVAMLEDLVLAALHDVNARLVEIQRSALGPLGDILGGG